MKMPEMEMEAQAAIPEQAGEMPSRSLVVITLIMITAIVMLAANLRDAASMLGWW